MRPRALVLRCSTSTTATASTTATTLTVATATTSASIARRRVTVVLDGRPPTCVAAHQPTVVQSSVRYCRLVPDGRATTTPPSSLPRPSFHPRHGMTLLQIDMPSRRPKHTPTDNCIVVQSARISSLSEVVVFVLVAATRITCASTSRHHALLQPRGTNKRRASAARSPSAAKPIRSHGVNSKKRLRRPSSACAPCSTSSSSSSSALSQPPQHRALSCRRHNPSASAVVAHQ